MDNLRFMEIAPDMRYEIGQDKKSHFPEWDIKDDKTLFNKVRKLAHSTFDLSKFTVVGNPTITNDGIASGFNGSNYITQTIDFSKPFKLTVKIKTPASVQPSSSKYFLITDTRGLDLHLASNGRIAINIGTTAWAHDLVEYSFEAQANTNYLFLIEWTGTKYIVDINGTQVRNVASTSQILSGSLIIGAYNNNDSYSWNGSIDLKWVNINGDRVPVFSGCKTGIDVIKPNNYITAGSPTISDDGIASGFSATNYIYTNIGAVSSGVLKFKAHLITSSTVPASNACLLGIIDTNGSKVLFSRTKANKLQIIAYTNSTNLGSVNIDLNPSGKEFDAEIVVDYTNTRTTINIYQNYSLVESKYLNFAPTFDNTAMASVTSQGWLSVDSTLIIDLNTFKVYKNDNLISQACLNLPYTEAENNNKFVDVTYRDRVKDLFEQTGYNGYYTIDENNKNFTLPTHKFSDVIIHKENGTTVAEQRVDMTLTQRGMATNGTDVNLPMEFFSGNSYGVVGVTTSGTNTASKFTPSSTGYYLAIGKGKI